MAMTIRRFEAAPCGCCPSDREVPLEGLHQRLASLEADRKAAAEAETGASPACPEHGLLGGPDGSGCRLCADLTRQGAGNVRS